MAESRSTGTQTNKRKAHAIDGALEVGQGALVTIPKVIPHGFQNNFTVRLTYADTFRHDVACNGTNYSQTFRMDSIFDPDLTGTGHQPLLRDLWASQYDFYAVLACEYQIKLFNAAFDSAAYTAVGTSQQQNAAVSVISFPSTNIYDFQDAVSSGVIYPGAEMKNAQTQLLVPDDVVMISGTLTPGDFLVDAIDSDNDRVWTAVGSNSAVPRIFGYVLSPLQQSNPVGAAEVQYASIQVQVILNYTVQFTQMHQSLRTAAS